MNSVTKVLSMLSAVALLAACETAPPAGGNAGGNGGLNGGNGQYGSNDPDVRQMLAPGVPDRVFFGYDSSVVDSEGQDTLQKQATYLRGKPSNITVEGHCDERGTREYNLALGERRAAAAKKYLAGVGITSSRISTISYGKERPAVIGSDESSWSQNRRAVTVLTNQ